ncbi:MAG: NAD(P)-binding protein [Helicobacter sp.]|nr:NAD(P)-binding protein [Helicobacter sp.]
MKIGVVGGGISGMSVARLLSKDFEVEVLEKESVVGGIARTKNVNGLAYHVNGGHIFASKYQDVREFVFSKILPENQWNIFRKNTKTLFKNHWISHPIENAILEIDKFDSKLAFQITKEMFSASYEKGRNLEEWFSNHFGPTLTKEYFIPYNTKIWGLSPKDMDNVWTIDDKQMKLPVPTKENFYNSLVHKQSMDKMVEAVQGCRYPKTGNQNTFIEAIGKGVKIITNYAVENIENQNNKWIINGEKKYDILINTSPLDVMHKKLGNVPNDIERCFNKLKFNRISNVLCEIDENIDFTWAYISSKDIGVHRINNTGILCSPRKNHCTIEKLGSHSVEYFKEEIKKLPFIGKILDHNITERAYVVFDLNYTKSKEKCVNYLKQIGLFPHGRFGEWEYYNMDVCIKRSIDLAQNLKSDYLK